MVSFEWVPGMAHINKGQWNRLIGSTDSPFLEYEWLHLLEQSGSIHPSTGWHPRHLLVRQKHRLVAAAPFYVKTSSVGEFVFDQIWAEVAQRLGIPYYPKLVGMSPVTPMTGYRFLVDDRSDERQLTRDMLAEIDRFCHRNGLAGAHLLFAETDWMASVEPWGYQRWMHQSFRWTNPGMDDFADYLARFNTNQRRNVKRERRSLADQGIRIDAISGKDLPSSYYDIMYECYRRTNDKFGLWGCRYLTPAFFAHLKARFSHRLLFMVATRDGHRDLPLGLSMLVTKGRKMYGRYWGSLTPVPHLHFNACYYAPIDWAIRNGVHTYDPGMGGEHKLRRGFEVVPNYSLHRFYDERLQQVMAANIDRINRLEGQEMRLMNREIPFSRAGS